ncbi:hypothetical protein Hanom_Chr13g01183131 [Helianthus anomalus]
MISMISPKVPPDIPPDLGSGCGAIGSEGVVLSEGSALGLAYVNGDLMNMSSEQGMSEVVVIPTGVSKVSRGFQFSDSGIAYWIVLSEVDLLFLKGMLGDNWVFRMFNEKLEIGSSDLRVSFKSESDLVGVVILSMLLGCMGLYMRF